MIRMLTKDWNLKVNQY